MADYSELKRKAQEIRDEVKAGANTANRVGVAMEETVNAIVNIDNELADTQNKTRDNTANISKLQNSLHEITPKTFTESEKDALEAQGLWEAELNKYPLVYVLEN
jgi:predicted nuclease with TOPRIM domain